MSDGRGQAAALTRNPRPTASALGLAALLLGAGIAHFLIPEPYRRIVPRLLPDPSFWVWSTGCCEIACAALVAHPRTRRRGAWIAIVLFVAVFPANVQMALDGGIQGQPFPLGSAAVAWLRLPLQVPLVVWAYRVSRSATAP